MKALAYLMGFLVSMVPALAPAGGPGDADGSDASTTLTGDGTFSQLDALLDAANHSRDPGADASEPANATAPEPAPANDTNTTDPPPKEPAYVKPKRAPEPAPFVAAWEDRDVVIPAGGAASLRLVVTNHHPHPLTVKVNPGNVTPGWHLSLFTSFVSMEPGESAEVPVTFAAPSDARAHERGRFDVMLASVQPFSIQTHAVTARVPAPEVVRDVDATVQSPTRYVAPGSTVNYTISVQNRGTDVDTFFLRLRSSGPGWSGRLTDPVLTLDPSEVATLTLTVRVPDDARNGDASFFNVTAVSRGDADATARLSTFTVVDGARAGSPIDLQSICVNNPAADETPPGSQGYVHKEVCLDLARLFPSGTLSTPQQAGDDVEDAAS